MQYDWLWVKTENRIFGFRVAFLGKIAMFLSFFPRNR
jgi:hypothetical protein